MYNKKNNPATWLEAAIQLVIFLVFVFMISCMAVVIKNELKLIKPTSPHNNKQF
jgi:uncharacterized protein YqhQ